MADLPSEATNKDLYTDNVYAATPSSGSGGEEEEEDEKSGGEIQKTECISNYLEPPSEENVKNISEWVTQAATYNADNLAENDEEVQEAAFNKTEDMEQDDIDLAHDDKEEAGADEGMENGTSHSTDTAIKNDAESKEVMEKGEENCLITTFKIFVSNLPPGLDNSELKELFLKYGEVVECEIFAKNYAFVHMVSEDAGKTALVELNGLDLRGCKINVKRSVQAGYPSKAKKESEEPVPVVGLEVGTYKLYIGNLPEDVTKEYVSNLLEPFGRAVEVEIYRNNAAFVHMEKEESGRKAIEELNEQTLPECEKPLKISESKNPEGPSVATIKLLVKNLSTTVLADEVRDLFIPYGLVLKVVISPKIRSNGFRTAIVHFEQFGNIRSAIKELNGKEVGGSAIQVEATFDKPEKPKPKPKSNKFVPPFSRRSSRPLFSLEEPAPPTWPQHDFPPSKHHMYPQPSSWTPPNKMRLIPMPSKSDLSRSPKGGKGRRLLRPSGPPPPPLMTQELFPAQSHWGAPWGNDNNFRNNHGYDEALEDGFGGGYSNYNEREDYNEYDEYDWSEQPVGNDFAPPPLKIPRNNSWNNSGGFVEKPAFQKARNSKQNYNNKNYNNTNYKGKNVKGMFPEIPKQHEFPKVPKTLMSLQIPQAEECDWSSDPSISNFTEFSNNQFACDEPASSSLNAVPFDYSQMKKKNSFPQRQQNSNAQAYFNPSSQWKGNKNKSGKGNKGNKGKSRRPGLGTPQQQKKIAHQTGAEKIQSSSTTPGEWQPVNNSSTTHRDAGASSSGTYAPYYFQQNWSVTKGDKQKQNRKPTAKQIKEAEEDQKRQYSDYLKQKPWLYQAIPGTVKKVQ